MTSSSRRFNNLTSRYDDFDIILAVGTQEQSLSKTKKKSIPPLITCANESMSGRGATAKIVPWLGVEGGLGAAPGRLAKT